MSMPRVISEWIPPSTPVESTDRPTAGRVAVLATNHSLLAPATPVRDIHRGQRQGRRRRRNLTMVGPHGCGVTRNGVFAPVPAHVAIECALAAMVFVVVLIGVLAGVPDLPTVSAHR